MYQEIVRRKWGEGGQTSRESSVPYSATRRSCSAFRAFSHSGYLDSHISERDMVYAVVSVPANIIMMTSLAKRTAKSLHSMKNLQLFASCISLALAAATLFCYCLASTSVYWFQACPPRKFHVIVINPQNSCRRQKFCLAMCSL
jgi:hypothetical protein